MPLRGSSATTLKIAQTKRHEPRHIPIAALDLIVMVLIPPSFDAKQSESIMHAISIRRLDGWTSPFIHNDLGACPLE